MGVLALISDFFFLFTLILEFKDVLKKELKNMEWRGKGGVSEMSNQS